MADELEQLAASVRAACSPPLTPHGTNLLHQVRVTSGKRAELIDALRLLTPGYLKMVACAEAVDPLDLGSSITSLAEGLDEYLCLTRTPEADVFVAQSDFRTSIVPEFILRIARRYIALKGHPFSATGQADIPIEIAFDLKRPGLLVPRRQRVDFAIVQNVALEANGQALKGFCIPLFAGESKTYFDKNMISGVAYSVAALKTTFPHCVYVGIGEFADFELGADSYASSEIDEIYILRKQKRSDFRKTKVANPVSSLLLREIVDQMIETVEDHTKVHIDLKLRVPAGRLIRGNPDL